MGVSVVRRVLVAAGGGVAVLLGGCTTQVDGQASPAAELPSSESSPSPGADEESSAPEFGGGDGDEDEPATEPVWDAADLTALLEAYADDETEDWAAFDGDSVVQVPCGGEGAHGLSPEVVETTAGGNVRGASAQVFTDATAAAAERDRLADLLAGCDEPFDYVSASTGEVLTRCEAPVVTSLHPVLQYDEHCDIGTPQGTDWAVFRTGNAVVAVSAPGGEGLFDALPQLLEALGAEY